MSESQLAAPGSLTVEETRRLRELLAGPLELSGEIDVELIAGGRSNPTYRITNGERGWVLRRPPRGLVLESAHDMSREYRVMSALAESGVPVPRTVLACDDPEVIGAPFYLMEWLDGRTIRTREDASALRPPERRGLADAMVRTLVDLHSVDPAAVGLETFGRAEGYLDRQLRRWRRQWDAAHTHPRSEIDHLFATLGNTVPETIRTGIVHGDYKVDNLMISKADSSSVLALLDWEMSTLGDTLADVGLMLSFWDEIDQPFNPLTRGVTALEGFPTRQELLESYANGAGLDDVGAIDWYVTLADLKIAVIFEQIHVRHLAGQTVGEGFEGMGDMVDPLLERAVERLARVRS
ncbi:phosphotransferase family protein [Microbacterium sp. AGC85]